jgi:hypothetical protein
MSKRLGSVRSAAAAATEVAPEAEPTSQGVADGVSGAMLEPSVANKQWVRPSPLPDHADGPRSWASS